MSRFSINQPESAPERPGPLPAEAGRARAIGDAEFRREVLESDVPVLVDFWAQWCGPCRILGPTLEVIAAEYAGRVKVVKVDVDANTTPAQYGIRSIPTVMLFDGGEIVNVWVGARPKDEYVRGLADRLAPAH